MQPCKVLIFQKSIKIELLTVRKIRTFAVEVPEFVPIKGYHELEGVRRNVVSLGDTSAKATDP